MRRRQQIALIVVALVLTLAWVSRPRPSTPGEEEANGAGSEATSSSADPDFPPLDPILRPRAGPSVAEAPPVSTPTPDPEAPGARPASPGHVRLRIEGPSDWSARPVSVHLQAECTPARDHAPGFWRKVDASETELAAERLLDVPDLSHVELRVEHPDFLAERILVPREDLDEEIVIRLRPAVVVVGRVLLADATPFVQAHVALHEIGPDAPMHDATRQWISTAADSTVAGPDGRFRLKVATPAEYLLIAGQYRFAPVCRNVTPARGETTDVGDLTVSEGARITGRLTVQGRPAASARLEAASTSEGTRFTSSAGGRVVWNGRTVRAERVGAETDEEGRFTLSGLAPAPHRIALAALAKGAPAYSGALAPLGEVTAPAQDVELAVNAFELSVRTREGDDPAPGVTVMFDAGWANGRLDATRVTTDRRGEALALLRPHTTYTVQAIGESGVAATAKVTTGEVGASETLALQVAAMVFGEVLVVRLRAEDGSPIEAAYLRCRSESGGVELAMGHPMNPTGDYRIELPQAGRWHVRVHPGTAEDSPRGTDYVPLELDIDVPEDGEALRTLTAVPGGRLLIELRDASGAFAAAAVHIRGPTGVVENLRWEIRGPRSILRNASALNGAGPALGMAALPPGTYEVELVPRDETPLTRTVEVRAKDTTRVELTLPPR